MSTTSTSYLGTVATDETSPHPVGWPDAVDEILGGDQTAALLLTTPAGGALAMPVSPLGLRDRDAGTVSFTTSRSFGKKMEHIARDPRVGLCFHSRDHALRGGDGFVVVQGRASVAPDDPDRLDEIIALAEPFEGTVPTGWFWDRWLAAYVGDRVEVAIDVDRVVAWPTTSAVGDPDVSGAPLPVPPAPQQPPAKGTTPRVKVEKVASALEKMPHRLLAWTGSDGYPTALPVRLVSSGTDGVVLSVPASMPAGGRRTGLLSHRYNRQLVGLGQQVCTGWAETVDETTVRYAPHTCTGFNAPANKTLLLLAQGYAATRMQKKARRAAAKAGR